jgi:hypothetical protein
LAGIDPLAFLKAETQTEIDLLTLVGNEAIKSRERHEKNLAAQIINNLGKALSGTHKTSGTQRDHRGSPQGEGRSPLQGGV